MCEPDSPNPPLMEGYLRKRPRGRKRTVGTKAEFEERFFRLTSDKLEYWKNNKKKARGSFEMVNVKVIEEVSENVFGKSHCFQIANETECMYMAASSQEEMDQWMKALRQVVQQKEVHMLPNYHPGFYDKKWTCCEKKKPYDKGCTPTGSIYSAYEESEALHDEERFNTSGSTLKRKARLSESFSSSGTLKSQDTHQSFSSDDSTHHISLLKSPDNPIPEIKVFEEDSVEPRERTGTRDSGISDVSGIGSRTSSAVSSFSMKSGASALSGSSSRCDSMDSVLQKPRSRRETNDGDKQRSSHLSGKQHQRLHGFRSLPLATVRENTAVETDDSYVLEKPQPTVGTETIDRDKQKHTHLSSIHHQHLQGFKSLPLATVIEDTAAEIDVSCEDIRQEAKNPNVSTCRQLAEQPITAVAFISSHVIVYATGDHHVCIYNASEDILLYDVKLTHPVSTLDVWNEKYILVGSSPVQLFEMKTDCQTKTERLRRTVVMDSKDTSQLTAASSYLGAFLPSGWFATANETSNEVVLWPLPTEDQIIITEASARLPIETTPQQILSMWGSGDSEQPRLAIVRAGSSQTFAVDVFDCRGLTAVELSNFEKMYLTFEESGRLEIEKKYRSSVTTTGKNQSPKVHIPVALEDGTIVLYEDLTAFSTCDSDEHSHISSLVCMEANGSTLVAAGYENGKLGLWGGEFEVSLESDLMEEIFTTQVFFGDSFYRESLLCDYYEFTADFNGGKFENYPSYSLEIPRGAIPKGEEVVIRTGIMKYGPCGQFECPDDIDIVSPIVWLYSNNPNFQFLKPAILEMQHCCSTPESLVLLKAGHDNTMDAHGVFEFQVQTSSHKCSSSKYYQSREINHFCLYCYGVYCSQDGVQRGFRLIPVERVGYMDKTHQVTFCLTYNLNCCQKAVKEQYPSNDYKMKQSLPVHFQDDKQIDIDYPRGSNGWLIAKTYPGHSIGLEDLNWEQKFPTKELLISAHKNKEYPPRFILELCGKDAEKSVTISVSLTNVMRPVSYDIILNMPCELEKGQEEMHMCPCLHLSDDSGIGDDRNSPPTYRPFH